MKAIYKHVLSYLKPHKNSGLFVAKSDGKTTYRKGQLFYFEWGDPIHLKGTDREISRAPSETHFDEIVIQGNGTTIYRKLR